MSCRCLKACNIIQQEIVWVRCEQCGWQMAHGMCLLKRSTPRQRKALGELEVLDKPIICNRLKGHMHCTEEIVESRQSTTPAELRKEVCPSSAGAPDAPPCLGVTASAAPADSEASGAARPRAPPEGSRRWCALRRRGGADAGVF